MQDERDESREDGMMVGSDDHRDVLGELIRAAGRRPTPPAEDYERVFAATHEAWQRKVRSRQRRHWVYALAAGLATVAIGLTTVVQLLPGATGPMIASTAVVEGDVLVRSPNASSWQRLVGPEVGIVAGSRLRSSTNGRASFNLAESISVRVNSGSELTFVSPEQLELIAGTVYVDSGAGMATDRFEIATEFGTVRDIGTQFEVNAEPAALRIRIREGAVQLFQSGEAPRLEGAAGEEVRLDSAGAIQRLPFSPFDPEWAWAESLAGMTEVEGQSLLGFLSWVARETGRELRFTEPGAEVQARSVILHGSARDLTPMQALDAMLATTDFEYSLLDEGVILIRRRGLGQ